MKNSTLARQQQKIEDLINKTDNATNRDLSLQSEWAKYLCIVCAGFLENALQELYSEFADVAASEPVARFVKRELSFIQNPKSDRFIEIAKSFKEEWAKDLNDFMDKNGGNSAINSIMSNRHNIAHGKDSTITLSLLKDYFQRALKVIEHIEKQLNS